MAFGTTTEDQSTLTDPFSEGQAPPPAPPAPQEMSADELQRIVEESLRDAVNFCDLEISPLREIGRAHV